MHHPKNQENKTKLEKNDKKRFDFEKKRLGSDMDVGFSSQTETWFWSNTTLRA